MNPLEELERLHKEATPGPLLIEQNVVYALGSHGFNRMSASVYGGESTTGGRTSTSEVAATVRILALSRNIVGPVIELARAVSEVAHELNCKALWSRPQPCDCEQRDLFAALDALLRAIESEVSR